jgi:hypothetical protein
VKQVMVADRRPHHRYNPCPKGLEVKSDSYGPGERADRSMKRMRFLSEVIQVVVDAV